MDHGARTLIQLASIAFAAYVAFQFVTLFSADEPQVEQPPSLSAYVTTYGEPVKLGDYFGDLLWVDYAAEWCSYCGPQTRTLKTLAGKYRDRLAFLTVVTGTAKVMEPPTAETARAWAARFGLDPKRVLAHYSTNTLPYHVLYSPAAEVLFEGSGLYTADRIGRILEQHLPESF